MSDEDMESLNSFGVFAFALTIMRFLYHVTFLAMCGTVGCQQNIASAYCSMCNSKAVWDSEPCILEEPRLTYSMGFPETSHVYTIEDDVWIGYCMANVSFIFLGCSNNQFERTINITHMRYCLNVCNGGAFGIRKLAENRVECGCVHEISTITVKNCSDGAFALFTNINVNSLPINPSAETGDCLTYYHPTFQWSSCNQTSALKMLCSKEQSSDKSNTANAIDAFFTEWLDGNKQCLEKGMFPSSVISIINAKFTETDRQFHWTGVIKRSTLLNLSAKGSITTNRCDTYAYLRKDDKALQFAHETDIKKALCSHRSEITKATTTDWPMENDFTTEADDIKSATNDSKKFPAAEVGIGVTVAILVLIGAVVLIIIIKRRGTMTCSLKVNENNSLAFQDSRSREITNDPIVNHDNVILEKCVNLVEDNTDHYNIADEQSDVNAETGNYNSINDIEHVKDACGEYDYTTHTSTNGPSTRKPDNVYNKLKIDRSGDYDQVDRREHNISKANNDYDSTSAASSQRKDDISDYDHIPAPVIRTLT